MEFSHHERARRYLRLAERAAAQGRLRHERIFRQLAKELTTPAS